MNPTSAVSLTVQSVSRVQAANGYAMEIALADANGLVVANVRNIDMSLATMYIVGAEVLLTMVKP